ncbi:hypothetical protein IKQ26_07755 [bacterium]|nr:hypothetical protein [bacterium]
MKILPKHTNNVKLSPINVDKEPINKTLEGVLINNHYKKDNFAEDIVDFSEISNNLLISESSYDNSKDLKNNKEQSFDLKKAMMPLLIAAGCTLAATLGVSALLSKVSKNILNINISEQLPDLALNMNIKQEPHFATYRMLRDPSFKNMIGAAAVFAFSGLTIMGRNFLSATKEVWVKKQQADIERDLQENLIDVEAQAFSGKLKVVNNMLNENVKYFKRVLNPQTKIPLSVNTMPYMNFKGKIEDNTKETKPQKDNKTNNKKQGILLGLTTLGVCLAGFFVGRYAFRNLRKTMNLANDYTNNYATKIINDIEQTVEAGIKSPEVTTRLDNCFQAISAKPERIREVMGKLKYSAEEIDGMIASCTEAKRTIFADAPTALGGIPKKIQYYCYLDENRGHLYNWVIHPENKFTKYVFLSFTAVSVVGAIVENAFDMLKMVGVEKENAKTELNLKKRLVDVEIRNFKAKKDSAIRPLIDDFNKKLEAGADKQELRQKADNILVEIKNGPPYVYS